MSSGSPARESPHSPGGSAKPCALQFTIWIGWSIASGERPEADIHNRLELILEQPGWITEGAYRAPWVRRLLDRTDWIVWLDPPATTCIYRMLKRHLSAELIVAGVGWLGSWATRGGLHLGNVRRLQPCSNHTPQRSEEPPVRAILPASWPNYSGANSRWPRGRGRVPGTRGPRACPDTRACRWRARPGA